MSKEEPFVSVAEAARQLGIHYNTLYRNVKNGAVRSQGGKVRISEARADRSQRLDHRKADPAPDIAVARAKKEEALAELRRLDLAERQGNLVHAGTVEDAVFRAFREDRDALLNWPARISAVIAADLGVDAGKMLVILEKHVREFLAGRVDSFEVPRAS